MLAFANAECNGKAGHGKVRADAAMGIPHVARVFTREQLMHGAVLEDQISRRVMNGFYERRGADVYLLLEDNVVLYKVEKGRRSSIAPKGTAKGTYGVKHKVPSQVWNTLRATLCCHGGKGKARGKRCSGHRNCSGLLKSGFEKLRKKPAK